MFKDQMTPKERETALSHGQAVDRLPIGIMYGLDAHRLSDCTLQQEWESAHSLASVQKKVYDVLKVDSLGTGHGLHGLGMLYGTEYLFPPHAPISLTKFVLNKPSEVENLDLELANIKFDVRAKKCLDCLEILREDLGQEVGCGMSFAGPFTAAAGLLKPEKMLRFVIKEPENIHKLLAFATQAMINLIEPFLKAGFNVCLAEPMATGVLLSAERFDKFVAPYNKIVIEAGNAIRQGSVSLHICGDTTPILNNIADCGYKSISLDNAVDLEVVKNAIGHKAHIVGNVHPTDIMYLGNPMQVRAAVRQCFRQAGDSPMGFTVSTGCDCAYGTPLENLLAYMDEAKYCASLPIRADYYMKHC